MATARIQEIQRQKDPELKRAVALAAEGNAKDSLIHVKAVIEVPEANRRHGLIAQDYLGLDEASRQSTLIVTGKNESRRAINQLIRRGLKLEGRGKTFDTLLRVDMTQAQRRFAPSYQPGVVIQLEKDYKREGLTRGELLTVVEAQPGNHLVVRRASGALLSINPRTVTQISVYHLEKQELSVGDLIRINRNEAALDLTNGDRFRVKSIYGGTVQLESPEGQRVVHLDARKALHLELAYSSTVHSSQ